LPKPERVVFHYVGGRVEAEVFLPHHFFEHGRGLLQAEQQVAQQLAGHPYFSAVSLNCQVVPA
jgi:hypothetical protein